MGSSLTLKTIILPAFLFCAIMHLPAQLVFSGGAKMKFNGGTAINPIYLVLDNPTANPILTNSVNDGMIMEDEYNCFQYNLKTGSTSVTVPYMSLALEKLPLSFTPTAAGTGNGSIRFSAKVAPATTTGFNNQLYMPSDVTNMAAPGISNNSNKTIDRFWIIDANGYTTKPGVQLSFTYSDAEWAANGGNTIAESNLQAQRFNASINDWGGYIEFLPVGVINTSNNTVSSVSVSAANFYRSWTLNDFTTPLPIGLINFDLSCNGEQMWFKWSTASETNNSHFTIESSRDGINFTEVIQINGQGVSAQTTCYEYKLNLSPDIGNYFRLKQTDFDGNFSYSGIQTKECDIQTEGFSVFPNPANELFSVITHDENAIITITDMSGKQITTFHVTKNISFPVNCENLSQGVYLITRVTNQKKETKKILITH